MIVFISPLPFHNNNNNNNNNNRKQDTTEARDNINSRIEGGNMQMLTRNSDRLGPLSVIAAARVLKKEVMIIICLFSAYT